MSILNYFMFTGLVECIGIVDEIVDMSGGKTLLVRAPEIMQGTTVDDSIAVNGVCLTVEKRNDAGFWATAVEETLAKTTLGILKKGEHVNIERAMSVGDRLGGHIVQGHVDCVGSVLSISALETSWELWVEFPKAFGKYIILTGSICIDGISFTIAECTENSVKIAIIPHTWNNTSISQKNIASSVNIEFDVLGKYIERLLPRMKINELRM